MRGPNLGKVIDLFAGAGGLSLGFKQAGFELSAAVDSDTLNVDTYRSNLDGVSVLHSDIRLVGGVELLAAASIKRGALTALVGGPPCQGFSMMGRRKTDDPRNSLLLEVARLAGEIRPRYVIVENVPGLRFQQFESLRQLFLENIAHFGYEIDLNFQSLTASDFGIPQRRRRLFFVARQPGEKPVRLPIAADRAPTVWDAIGDLPSLSDRPDLDACDVHRGPLGAASEYAKLLRGCRNHMPGGESQGLAEITGCLRPRHSPAVVRRFAATLPGTREPVSRFERLPKYGLAGTLRAGTSIEYGKYMAPRPIHPVEDRCISVREAARLQSFPDWFAFHPTRWHGFQQVGNAVPPLLAQAVAQQLASALK